MRSAANCALGRRAQSPARVLRSAAASDNCTTVKVALPLRASLTSCARRSQEQSAIAQLPKSLRGRERSRAVHKTPIPGTARLHCHCHCQHVTERDNIKLAGCQRDKLRCCALPPGHCIGSH